MIALGSQLQIFYSFFHRLIQKTQSNISSINTNFENNLLETFKTNRPVPSDEIDFLLCLFLAKF